MFEVTNSSISLFKRCRYQWYLEYVLDLVPIVTPPYFDDGDIFHCSAELFYQGSKHMSIMAYIDKRYNELIKNVTFKTNKNIEDIEMRKTIMQGMMTGYYKLRKKDRQRWKVIYCEKEFEIPCVDMNGDPFLYRGKRDMKMQDQEDGLFWVVEHKTAGQITTKYVRRLPMDTQVLTYLWADKMVEPKEQQAAGCLYNVIKKPGIRLRQKETNMEFLKRLTTEYKDLKKYYHREKIPHKKVRLTKFYKEMQRIVPEMKATAEQMSLAHKNERACDDYGGCSYYEICLKGKMRGPHMTYYKKKETTHPELARR